ncbi:MAG TPA: hypothetical protein VID75_08615 [Acidimicrobiales bacterium]
MVYQDKRTERDGDGGGTVRKAPVLGVGSKICVRNRFLGDWSMGFEVADVLGDGYRIRRVSDGLSFPDVFPFDEVRLERRLDPERGVAGSCLDREE